MDEEKLPALLKSVDSMEQDFGFPLNMPPYESYSPNVGRMSGMLPGLFENGGIYCHATGFKILMDCKLGRGRAEAARNLKNHAGQRKKSIDAVGSRTVCFDKLLFYTSEVLWKIILVMDNRYFSLGDDGAV